MEEEKARVSSLDRLRRLGEVFDLHDVLAEEGMTENNAHTWLMRTVNLKHIAQAGGRSGIYYNLVKDPDGPRTRRLEAVARMYPSAVVVGVAVLFKHGLIAEEHLEIDVAIPKAPSTRTFEGVHFVTREKSWFVDHQPRFIAPGEAFKLASLTPGDAVEDARVFKDVSLPPLTSSLVAQPG